MREAWTLLHTNYSDDSDGHSYGQLVIGSFITTKRLLMSHAGFFCETSNNPGDSASLQSRFGAPWLLAFPKTKITFESEETSDRRWDSEIYNGAADGDSENCLRFPRCLLWWALWHHCPMYNVSCIFSKCLYFSCYMPGFLLDRPHISWMISPKLLTKETHHTLLRKKKFKENSFCSYFLFYHPFPLGSGRLVCPRW